MKRIYLPLKTVFFLALWNTNPATAAECPFVYEGKPLASAEVFDGPIATGQPQAPERNRWVINPIPSDFWDRYPPYYLQCKYRGATDIVSIELPRSTRICRPIDKFNIRCR